jgi:hypothetical protein
MKYLDGNKVYIKMEPTYVALMKYPRVPHLALIKHILRYVMCSLSIGLHLGTGPVDQITTYSDAGLGWLPQHTLLHLWLLHLPQQQSGALVLQTPDHGFPLQC